MLHIQPSAYSSDESIVNCMTHIMLGTGGGGGNLYLLYSVVKYVSHLFHAFSLAANEYGDILYCNLPRYGTVLQYNKNKDKRGDITYYADQNNG